MKISLINNGLDSIKKGYRCLKKYTDLDKNPANEVERYSMLKDAILNMQHGIEILFKYILREKNEVLLYAEVNSRLKQAFAKRRDGEINELFELDGVHTVSFKESLERVRDICGIDIGERLHKKLLKVEGWRNSIIHSAVSLPEFEVSGVLGGLMNDLDRFFSVVIGEDYANGQGHVDLERAYNLFMASNKGAENVKATVVERLIASLKHHGIKNVTSPGVFLVEDNTIACGILEQIQGDDLSYGCDLANYHCSGRATIAAKIPGDVIRIYTEDNDSYYDISVGGIVVYVPPMRNDQSPMVFVFSKDIKAIGDNPFVKEKHPISVQEGFIFDSGREVWQSEEYLSIRNELYDGEFGGSARPHKIYRFLNEGCAAFLNVQTLEYGSVSNIIHEPQFQNIGNVYAVFDEIVRTYDKN